MNATHRFILIPLLLFTLFLACSCEKQKTAWQGSIEVIDGMTVIKNPSEPVYGEFIFDLEEDLSLGGDVNRENYYFPKRVQLTVDDEGNLYVLDTGNFRSQKYDSSGNYLATIGRKGQGPGEFQYPSFFTFDAKGTLWVFDAAARMLKAFTKNGTYHQSLLIRTFIQPQVFLSGEGFVFGWRDSFRPREVPKTAVLKIHPESQEEETIAEFQEDQKGNKSWQAIHYYSNRLALCPITMSLFCYGFSSEYKIYVANGRGEIVRIIEKNEEPTPIRREERDATLKDGKGVYAFRGRSRPPENWEGVDFPSHRPYFGRIISDDAARIYVSRQPSIMDQSRKPIFDVFGEDGVYLYRTELDFFPALINGGFLYEIREDEETGEITIVRYSIRNWSQLKTKMI